MKPMESIQNRQSNPTLFPELGKDTPAKQQKSQRRGREEVFNDYDGFVEKFKPKKTTDDCYTPPEVYEAVKEWVSDNILPLDGVEIVCPFFPGGDYENHHYPEGCVVLDNPPFSILAKIRRFYHARGIKYFLFAPSLTMANSAKELADETCFIIAHGDITYANGAVVRTSFVTNLDCGGTGVWLAGDLFRKIEAASEKALEATKKPEKPQYRFPRQVISSALMGKIVCRGVELAMTTGVALKLSNLLINLLLFITKLLESR